MNRCVCVCVCVCVWVYVCIHVSHNVCVCAFARACIHACMHDSVYVSVCVHACGTAHSGAVRRDLEKTGGPQAVGETAGGPHGHAARPPSSAAAAAAAAGACQCFCGPSPRATTLGARTCRCCLRLWTGHPAAGSSQRAAPDTAGTGQRAVRSAFLTLQKSTVENQIPQRS